MLNFGTHFNRADETENEEELLTAEDPKGELPLPPETVPPETEVAWEEEEREALPHGEIKRVPMPGRGKPGKKEKEAGEPEKFLAVEMLVAAREKAGLTREMVTESTRIRAPFLDALENGRFEELPPAVFVLAYLRRLCRLYLVSPEDEEKIVRPWVDLQCEIPENLPAKVVIDTESENSRIIRKVEIVLFASAAVVIVGLLLFGGIMLASRFSKDERPIPFDENTLLELQPVPVLDPAQCAAGRGGAGAAR